MVAITVAIAFITLPIDMPVLEKVNELLHPTLVVYALSGGAMFSCLCWITSDMFIILTNKVIEQTSKPNGQWSQRLDDWRHQHCTILQLVGKINDCYGGLLLVVIASTFVVMISTLFISIRQGASLNVLLQLFILLIQFGHFAMLIYVPHRIRESVSFYSIL